MEKVITAAAELQLICRRTSRQVSAAAKGLLIRDVISDYVTLTTSTLSNFISLQGFTEQYSEVHEMFI